MKFRTPNSECRAPNAETLDEVGERCGAAGTAAPVHDGDAPVAREGFDELSGALRLRLDFRGRRRGDGARRGSGAPFARGRWAGDLREAAVLDDELPGGDHRRDLGVAELFQEAPDVPVDRLAPE